MISDLNLDPFLCEDGTHRAISASSINKFRQCPESWRRRYILGERGPSNGNLVWGSADHRAIAHHLARKLEDGVGFTTEAVVDDFADQVEIIVADSEEIEWTGKDFEGKTPAQNVAQIKDRGTKMVAMYHKQVCPTIEPVAVEEKFDLEIPGLPLRVLGYVDLRARRVSAFGAGPEVIIERKTRSASRQRVAGAESFQAWMYQLAKPLPVQYHFSVKTVTPKLVGCFGENDIAVAPTDRTKDLIWQTLVGISTCYSIYGPDEAWPDALLSDWACSYCSYKPTCRWWRA